MSSSKAKTWPLIFEVFMTPIGPERGAFVNLDSNPKRWAVLLYLWEDRSYRTHSKLSTNRNSLKRKKQDTSPVESRIGMTHITSRIFFNGCRQVVEPLKMSGRIHRTRRINSSNQTGRRTRISRQMRLPPPEKDPAINSKRRKTADPEPESRTLRRRAPPAKNSSKASRRRRTTLKERRLSKASLG